MQRQYLRTVKLLKLFATDKIFNQRTPLESQTVFHENGRVSIIPLAPVRVSLMGDRYAQVVQRGRMITDDDGRSIFHPYNESGMPRYRLVLSSDHGDVKETRNGALVVTFRLPQDGSARKVLLAEAKEIAKRL